MSFQTYTRPRRAAVSPAARLSGGPVTQAIRALRPNEMPTWEIREAEMRRQEAADMRALRRRVAKAVSAGIDFLDQTGGDPDLEEGADDEPSLCGSTAERSHFALVRDSVVDGEDEPEEETLGWSDNVGQLALGPNTADGDATALERHGAGFIRSGHEDNEDSDSGLADHDSLVWLQMVKAGVA